MTSKQSLDGAPGSDDDEDVCVNPTSGSTIGDVIAERLDRRDLMKGALASAVLASSLPAGFMSAIPAEAQTKAAAFRFKEVEAGVDGKHYVAEGYDADILIRWGDPLLKGAPPFDPKNQTGASQAQQFGYNNDFL